MSRPEPTIPDQAMTLRRFFFDAGDGEEAKLRDPGSPVDELRSELGKQLGSVKWRMLAKEIGKQITAVLDFGIAEKILAPVWQRLQLLQEYRDPELHPTEESALVPLVEHRVASTHEPHIDLMLKDVELGRLNLQVELALDLDGVVLRVQNGRIWQVEGGSATGSGSLSCSYREKQLYSLKRQSRTFRLTTGLGFEKGIPIPDLGLLDAEDG